MPLLLPFLAEQTVAHDSSSRITYCQLVEVVSQGNRMSSKTGNHIMTGQIPFVMSQSNHQQADTDAVLRQAQSL